MDEDDQMVLANIDEFVNDEDKIVRNLVVLLSTLLVSFLF